VEKVFKDFNKEVAEIIKNGGVVVLPTDTLYGIIASVDSKEAVLKIGGLKERPNDKSYITLISGMEDIDKLELIINDRQKKFLEKIWPGSVTLIFPMLHDLYPYTHIGHSDVAVRMPKKDDLLKFLKETGPVIAPSANPNGKETAMTIDEAVKYFGKRVDAYVDQGEKTGLPSTVIRFKDEKIEYIRDGVMPFVDLEKIWEEIN